MFICLFIHTLLYYSFGYSCICLFILYLFIYVIYNSFIVYLVHSYTDEVLI